MKKILKLAAALATLAFAAHASATLSFSESIAGPGSFAAPIFTTGTPALAYTATDSLADTRLAPLGTTASYLIVSTGGSASVSLSGASSFSFLWGSPDLFNSILIATSTGLEAFTGFDLQTLFGVAANGDNANTRWFSLSGAPGQTLDSITFSSSGIAFEVAVTSPVPEPESYALLLAGLLIVFYIGGRTTRRHRD